MDAPGAEARGRQGQIADRKACYARPAATVNPPFGKMLRDSIHRKRNGALMPRVVALYRYPVKGFTPEACETLTVLAEGRIAGDRALGLRFANSPVPDHAWSRKYEFVALVNTPGLAPLDVRFDHGALRLRISRDGAVLVDAPLDDAGRRRIA